MPPNEVGEAYIAIRATTSGFAAEAKKGVTSELTAAKESAVVPIRTEMNRAQQEPALKQSVGSMVKSVAAYAGGIFAAVKVFDFAKSVVEEAAQVQKSEEAIRVEFGKTAGVVQDFADKEASSLGIAQRASEQYSASYGRILEGLGQTPKQAAEMATGFQRVIGTLAQVRGVDPTVSLEKMNTALATGSTRALRPLGIAFDSTQVKAEALKLGLAGITGPSALVEASSLKLEAAQNAYNKVLETNPKSSLVARQAASALTLAHQNLASATSKVSGTLSGSEKDQALYGLLMQHQAQYAQLASEHSGDYANQLIDLNVQVANAKAAIGEALLPAVSALVKEMVAGVKVIAEYKSEVVSVSVAIGAAVGAWVAVKTAQKAYALGTDIVNVSQKVLTGNLVFSNAALAAQKEEYLASAVGQEAYNAALAEGATATEAATIATEGLDAALLANPVGIVVAGVAILVGGLYELYTHSATARDIMKDTWQEVQKGVGPLKEIASAVAGFGAGIFGPVASAIGSVVGTIGTLVHDFQALRKEGFSLSDTFKIVGAAALADMGVPLGTARTIVNDVSTAISDARTVIVTGAHVIADVVTTSIADVKAVWHGFWDGPFGDEVRFAVAIVGAELMDVFRVVRDVFNIVDDLIHGDWGNAWHDLGALVKDGIRLMIVAILAAPAIVLHGGILIGEAIWHGIRGEVVKLPGQVWDVIKEIPGAELRGVAIIGNAAARLGRALLTALIHEADNAPGQIWNIIRGIPGAELRGIGIIENAAQRLGGAIVRGAVSEARKLPGQIRTFVEHIGPVISGLLPWLVNQGEKLGGRLIHGAIDAVKSLGGDLKGSIEDSLKGALSDLNPFSPVEHGAKVYIADPIMKGTTDALDPFQKELTQAIIPPMRVALAQATIAGRVSGRAMGNGIEGGILSGLTTLGASMGRTIVSQSNAAMAQAKKALGISSPSRLYAEQIGRPLAEGIVHGMGGLEAALAARITKAARAAQQVAGGFGGSSTPQGSAAIGSNQALGRQMMLAAGWGADQWGALQALWTRESGWNANAVNPSSGAYGIPQSLGHGHPYNLGDARAQIAWGLDYIRARYGSPGAAWAHETSVGWYGGGGMVPGPQGAAQAAVVHGGEVIFTPDQMRLLKGGGGVHVDQLVIVDNHDGRDAAHKFLNEVASRAR